MDRQAKPYTRNCEIQPHMVLPEGLYRMALGVEYQGSEFRGFQVQPHDERTVQGHLHAALSNIANEPITLVCAGRTDSGVHATGQVVHFDCVNPRPVKAWLMGVNTKLPDAIAVRWARHVPLDFHARFSATHRTYRYVIQNTKTRPGILRNAVTWDKRRLNLAAMDAAAQQLVGEHDFSAFRASICQANSPVRSIHYISIRQLSDYVVIEVRANAFLHHMVRNLVGVLGAIAAGEKPVAWAAQVLASRDRTQAGVTAPAAGLYLVDVGYDSAFDLPRLALGPGFMELPLHAPA